MKIFKRAESNCFYINFSVKNKVLETTRWKRANKSIKRFIYLHSQYVRCTYFSVPRSIVYLSSIFWYFYILLYTVPYFYIFFIKESYVFFSFRPQSETRSRQTRKSTRKNTQSIPQKIVSRENLLGNCFKNNYIRICIDKKWNWSNYAELSYLFNHIVMEDSG